MPILPLDIFLYPSDLLENPRPEGQDEKWWVLHCRPRAEKQLAGRILKRKHSFFLPLLHKRYTTRSRKFESYVPMFASYVFLHGSHEARLAALATNLVVHCLPVADQERLHSDLSNVHRLMLSDVPLTPENGLLPGTQVEITEGPFAGMSGKLLTRDNGLRLFVEVNFLKCGVSVPVDAWMVRAAESTKEWQVASDK